MTRVTERVAENREPLAPSSFYPLPLGSVRPSGWLRRQLQLQADGLGGHLDETWPDVGPESGWLGGKGESWERGPYFLDGLVPLAYLLDSTALKAKAQKYIDWTLNNQASDGMIGPSSNHDWWPRMVMLKVLEQYQEVTGDPRVIPALEKYFAYQMRVLPSRPLQDWGKFRWQDEVLTVVWLYNRTGNEALLDLARVLHQQGHDWQAQFANFKYTEPITREYIQLDQGGGLTNPALATHGVNNGMALKASPIWSLVSGSGEDRAAMARQLAALDEFHGLPNGMFSCDEHLAGRDPSHGSELCTVVETMFSLEQSLAILGDAALGDRLEKIAFNALPGTFTDDMWAHQYDQEPNQVECSLHTRPWTTNGPESNLYGLEPNFGCCTANFHQGWPKFTASLFMLSGDEDLVATAYSPCEVLTKIRGTPVQVVEETEYPFRQQIRLTVNPTSSLRFGLRLRIPAWAEGASITINGKSTTPASPRSFARIDRTWKRGDTVEVKFPFEPRLSRWFHDSVAVERGPLVFSYPIGEGWLKLRDQRMTADWQVFPRTQWNYAVALSAKNAAAAVAVEELAVGEKPFAKPAPVVLTVKARKLNSWRSEDGAALPIPQSPVSSDEQEESIQLIPYAAAKLRITAFPQLQVNAGFREH
ncbi:MAG: glycoside hydrolase family 127 protein [Acidobacteria bacterium]|nr:glycoside hydrolase family 127 protein [Acidobacteriota bacterium]